MNLLNEINESLREHCKLLIIGECETVDINELIELQQRFATLKKERNLSRVALYGLSNFNTAKLITALDGIFDIVFLVPSEISQETLEEYCKELDVEIIICRDPAIINVKLALTVKEVESSVMCAVHEDCLIETRWVLMTSGTTGTPKLVSHTMSSLTNTVKKHNKYYENKWGLFYSPYRFAGLQVLLQSLLSGNSVVISETCNSLKNTIKLFVAQQVKSLSATPTIWRKVLMSEGAELLDLDLITLGGEIVDQNILNALKKCYPRARLIHIYASTEAGSGFSVTDGVAGFPKNYVSNSNLPFLLDISQEKTLLIKSSSRAHGYLGSNSFPIDKNGYIDTGDVVELINERYYFKGRDNGSINVGGLKVHPEEIEAILLSHPLVQLASVTAKKNSITGAIVSAQIVLAKNELSNKEAISEIKGYCRERLEPYKVPAIMKIKEDININSTGKTIR